MQKILDTATNVAVLAASILVCIWLAPQIRARWSSDTRRPPAYQVGDAGPKVADYGRSHRTIVLFVRSTCRYCTESMPFYRQLAESKQRAVGAVRFIVASMEPRETTSSYLGEHRVAVDDIVTVERDPKLQATPTLLVVSRESRVLGAWVGLQSASGRGDVERLLQ